MDMGRFDCRLTVLCDCSIRVNELQVFASDNLLHFLAMIYLCCEYKILRSGIMGVI